MSVASTGVAADAGAFPFAAFPMYDWPEVQWATDELWRAVAAGLAARGVPAPDGLTRSDDLHAQWYDTDLFMGQTCGLPYALDLRPHTAVLGAMTYDVGDLATIGPGEYCSTIVVRNDSSIRTVEDMRGSLVAFNNEDSQSGKGSLMQLLAPLAVDGRFFGGRMLTGGHRASVVAVASGEADVSAIDTISLALAYEHEADAAAELRAIHVTNPSPGTPFITNRRNSELVPQMREALTDAVAGLAPEALAAMHLLGFQPLDDEDYDVIARRQDAAIDLGYLDLD